MLVSLCLLMGLVWSVSSSFLEQLEKPEVREIKVRLEEEKAKRLLLQNDVEMLMLKVEQIKRKCDGGEETAGSGLVGTRQVKETISFSARLSAKTVLDLHHVVTFDQVLHNHGNGYSSNTGIFKAPVAGTYVFSLSALSGGKGVHFHLSIIKSGTDIAKLFSGSNTSTWADQGAVTVVTSLTETDEVYVGEFSTSGTLHGEFYCIFTGFQI